MKKQLLLLLFAAFCVLPLSAQTFEVDGINYEVTGENTCSVTSKDDKYSGDIVIPESVTYAGVNYPVTSIGESAFWDCSSLTSVEIPNSVTSIGNYAFFYCSSLTSVTYLAENPIEIYSNIFSNETYEKAMLNYLESAADKIDSTFPWNNFVNRIGRSADFVDSGIEAISGGSNEITEVYNLSGIKVGESLKGLPKGIYIVRQGAKTTKLAI